MMKKLVLCSGGLDSSSMLMNVVKEFKKENVIALNMFYGQRHKVEIQAFRNLVKKTGVESIEMDLSSIFSFNKNVSSLLSGSEKELEKGKSYAEELADRESKGLNSVVDTYIPNRNSLFINVATTIAMQKGCDEVFLGAHADDAVKEKSDEGKDELAAYPDCTRAFFESESKTIFLATGGQITIKCPLIDMSKSQVVAYGISGGMTKDDFANSWSCYDGWDGKTYYEVDGKKYPKPCCQCSTCIDRRNAFVSNGLTDLF